MASYDDFKNLAQAAGAVADDSQKTFSVTRGRHEIVGRYQRHKNTSTLIIHLRSLRLPAVYVRKESSIDRVGKRLGLNRELQTGDATFDQNAYVESDSSDEAVLKLLLCEQVRGASLLLLQCGFKHVEFGKDGVKVQMSGSNSALIFDAERFNEAAGALALMGDHLPRYEQVETNAPTLTRPILVTIGSIVALVGLLIFTGIASDNYPPLDWGPWTVGWACGAGAWLLWLPLCGRLVRGRSNAMRHFIISMLLMTIALPTGGAGTVVFLNGYLDSSPQVQHQTRVVRQWTTRSKNSTNYHTEVAGWNNR
ncbi:MAG TPA: hypothetical protein VEJ63_10225, partial [Planctomycetota bacterium]|nr:hypothetical protein [Planctomycetota bacterium]